MEVAAYVFDDSQPPPYLTRALNYKSWGVVDIMMLPAGLLKKMNLSLTVYNPLIGYRNAASRNETVKFSKENPDAWDIVTRVLKERKRGHNN